MTAPYDLRTVQACAEIAEKARGPMMALATAGSILAARIRELPTSSYPEPEGWRDIATELREFVGAVAGENNPARDWAIRLRDRLDVLLQLANPS